jgi:hypothetical protein
MLSGQTLVLLIVEQKKAGNDCTLATAVPVVLEKPKVIKAQI